MPQLITAPRYPSRVLERPVLGCLSHRSFSNVLSELTTLHPRRPFSIVTSLEMLVSIVLFILLRKIFLVNTDEWLRIGIRNCTKKKWPLWIKITRTWALSAVTTDIKQHKILSQEFLVFHLSLKPTLCGALVTSCQKVSYGKWAGGEESLYNVMGEPGN